MAEINFIDDLFDKFLQNKPIIKPEKHRVLSSTFIPDSLPHREQQMKDLASILASSVFRGSSPSNIFIYGKPGTGKTCVSKYVLNKLKNRLSQEGTPHRLQYAFVNCKENSTTYSIYTAISQAIQGEPIPPTGLPTSEVYQRLLVQLENIGTAVVIVVLDEIDEIVRKKGGSEILYNLTRLNTHLTKSYVSLVGISNDTKFKDFLDPRVYSSLSEEEIVFTPYKATELMDILQERALEAFFDNVLDNGVLSKIAALAARDHGDARRAIDLLRVAAELTERQGEQRITLRHVEEAKGQIEKNVVYEVAASLPLHSKLVLTAIYMLNQQNQEITTGKVYNIYSDFCKQNGFEIVSSRRVSDYLNEQDQLGLIDSNVVSKGRYGRTRKITLNVPKPIIREVLEKDSYVSTFIS